MLPNTSDAQPLFQSANVAAPLTPTPQATASITPSAAHADLLEIFNLYLPIFVISFLVTVCATPIMRRIAISQGIIDRPNEARKAHKVPIAYLGGLAVFLGVFAGIAYSYIGVALPQDFFAYHASSHDPFEPFPMSIVIGMGLITLTGLIDDVAGLDPRLKIAGQLLAAAALALDDVGVKVAAGFMQPIGKFVDNPDLTWYIDLPRVLSFLDPTYTERLANAANAAAQSSVTPLLELDLIYWTGTAIIAVFILGACNASNLIDGLDGLLSGVTAIAAAALLFVALSLAQTDDGPLDAARIILALALLGGCLGFLPHNFNPATIFLGDTGSLLLGYLTIVLVLSLGDTGKTHLVIAGLIIYAVPIIDTVLAIVRRKLAGKSMSEADDQHLHHMLKRSLGVKGAVLTLYGIGALFALLGVILTEGRVRIIITVAIICAAFIGVTAVKVARRAAIEAEARAVQARPRARKHDTRKQKPQSTTLESQAPEHEAEPTA